MNFDLQAFANALSLHLKAHTPYMYNEELDRAKHPKREPLHLKNALFDNLQIVVSPNMVTFDLGSEKAEITHPYYHILEDAQTIQKRKKGTKSSKGSQNNISDPSKRDYGIVNWNGKTYSQEYRKNVRGARNKTKNAQQKIFVVSADGFVSRGIVNSHSTYYNNIHYRYIEKAIELAIPQLCESFGLKNVATRNTSLADDYQVQESMKEQPMLPSIVDIFNSFEGE